VFAADVISDVSETLSFMDTVRGFRVKFLAGLLAILLELLVY
jgi:hypothetical protein